ncbi:MAG: universal stress protein [Thermoplasmata archaeon]|nr:universal stress protein [Thermoplasmata archaeon]
MKLLVPTAGPVPAQEKAEYISKLACSLEAEMIVLHIVQNNNKEPGKEAFKIFEDQCEKDNIKIKTIIKEGEVVPTISKVVDEEGVDLIVMGASAGRVVAKWLVADIMERSKVPVVIVPMGFEHMFD